jgi:hypothetical protein
MILWSNTNTGATILGMSPLPFEHLIIATLIGSLTFVVHVIQVNIPLRQFERYDTYVQIDQPGASQKIENMFNKISNCFSMADRDDSDSDDDNFK